MRWLWRKVRYDPGNDFEEEENNQIPDLEPVNDETFQIIPHNEQIESSDEDDDEGSAESNAEEEGSSNLPEPPAEHFLITGLPKPISKCQKKKQRKNKRKNVLTPPEDPKDSKLARRGETPEGSPSLVTKLIRKYSSIEVHEDGENGVPSEDKEASTTEGLQISPSNILEFFLDVKVKFINSRPSVIPVIFGGPLRIRNPPRCKITF